MVALHKRRKTVSKWGNSLAIRLPEYLNFKEGEVVLLEEIGGMVLIKRESDADLPRDELIKNAIDILQKTI